MRRGQQKQFRRLCEPDIQAYREMCIEAFLNFHMTTLADTPIEERKFGDPDYGWGCVTYLKYEGNMCAVFEYKIRKYQGKYQIQYGIWKKRGPRPDIRENIY